MILLKSTKSWCLYWPPELVAVNGSALTGCRLLVFLTWQALSLPDPPVCLTTSNNTAYAYLKTTGKHHTNILMIISNYSFPLAYHMIPLKHILFFSFSLSLASFPSYETGWRKLIIKSWKSILFAWFNHQKNHTLYAFFMVVKQSKHVDFQWRYDHLS